MLKAGSHMAKPRRIQFPGATYHVMSRGNRKARIFEDDCDRRRFLDLVADAVERYVVECPSFCLMGNHYHLIAHTPRGNLAPFMKMVNGDYAKAFNRRHRLTGHLFGGPYKPIVIGDSRYLRTAMAYVARNPVEAGLVATPEQWKWSSYAAAIGLCDAEPFMAAGWMERAFPSLSDDEARRKFADLVTHFPEELVFDERDVAFADLELRSDVRELIGRTMYLSELPRAYRAMARPDLSELLSCVTRAERIAAIRRAHVVYGYRLSEIARCMAIHPTTISRLFANSRNRRNPG